jgi:hypothetical protein
MNSPEEKEKKPDYLLVDGTRVSKDEAVKAGEKSRETFRIVAIFTFVVAVLLLIQYIIDLTIENSGWIFLVVVEVFLIGSGFLFLSIHRNLDPERYGISILNAKHRMLKLEPKDTLVFNDIQADIILELHLQYGNLLFIDNAKKRWQYRSSNRLSEVYGVADVAGISAKKDGNPFPLLIAPTEENGIHKHDYCIHINFVNSEKKPVALVCKSEEVVKQFLKEFQAFLSGQK